MNVRFKNQQGIEISESEASILASFVKIFLVNDKEKIMEYYESNQLDQSCYILDPNEGIDMIIDQYLTKKVTFTRKEIINNYTKTEDINYNNGILESKKIFVDDPNGNFIAFQIIDIVTNLPILGSTEKYYYDSSGEEKYIFDYDHETGDCFMIYDLQELGGCILASHIGKPDTEFTWNGFEYYQHANPIVPLADFDKRDQ